MASVQYLFSHAHDLRIEIKEKKIIFDWLSKFRNLCAIVIQKIWRGYMFRVKYLRIRRMIVVIQSYYRGWVVRKRYEQYVEQHAADMEELWRNRAAAIIQAVYRGYVVRKYMSMHGGSPAERLEKLNKLNDAARNMQEYIRNQFEVNSRLSKDSTDDEMREKVMHCLFKWHHLLRTKTREGIYSCHCSNKLSLIEELMKIFPFKRYMDNVHKCYENAVKTEPPPYYFFQSKKLQKYEDLLKKRDKNRDELPKPAKFSPNIRFNLGTRIRYPYEKSMLRTEKYTSKRIENDGIKKLKPFLLGNINLDLNDRTIPYFIDYFEKHKCNIHYPQGHND